MLTGESAVQLAVDEGAVGDARLRRGRPFDGGHGPGSEGVTTRRGGVAAFDGAPDDELRDAAAQLLRRGQRGWSRW